MATSTLTPASQYDPLVPGSEDIAQIYSSLLSGARRWMADQLNRLGLPEDAERIDGCLTHYAMAVSFALNRAAADGITFGTSASGAKSVLIPSDEIVKGAVGGFQEAMIVAALAMYVAEGCLLSPAGTESHSRFRGARIRLCNISLCS